QYYWTTATKFYIGSNGYISLDQGTQISSLTIGFPNIPTVDNTNNFVAPLLTDLLFGQGSAGTCYYYTNNVDTLIVSFIDVAFWNQANNYDGSNTFQVIFSGVDSSITIQYKDQVGQYDPAYNTAQNPVVIGIENITGDIGLEVTSNDLPTVPKAIRFEYPDTVTYSIIDVQPDWLNNVDNAGFFLLKNKGAIIDASVTNVGNTDVATSFVSNTQIIQSAGGFPTGTTVYNEDYSIGGLAASQTLGFSYGPIFNPATEGIYHVITQTALGTDLINSNDKIETELVVVDTSGVGQITLSFTDNTFESSFGFEGGAIYFVPPVYPVDITMLSFALFDNDTTTASNEYVAKIWDDDGAGGSAGTLLYDTLITSVNVVTVNASGLLQRITLDSAVTVDSGGFYVSWEVITQPQNTRLRTDENGPFSFRTYEVLGGVFGPYREADLRDLAIQAVVSVPAPDTTSLPVAVFSSSSSNGCLNDSISYYCQSLTATSYDWTFENGTPSTSSQQNITVTYNSVGDWLVTLIVSNANGSDTITDTITIMDYPTASFIQSVNTIMAGDTLSFTNSSSNATGFTWDFGDSSGTSTAISPNYSYADSGTFIVTLSAANACGTSQSMSTITVTPDTTTGIPVIDNQRSLSDLTVYPIPASDHIILEVNDTYIKKVEVYNMIGKLILTYQIKSKRNFNLLSTELLPVGMYFLKVYAEGESRTIKFSIVK
ncbi:PKD domain-containing protein, partial [Candidatus Amoebophilus asiaticus]|nr:PKD domain-containing protein [Candidatus Amoebophilus asiaticus]